LVKIGLGRELVNLIYPYHHLPLTEKGVNLRKAHPLHQPMGLWDISGSETYNKLMGKSPFSSLNYP
jgi:hypothetical protein